MRTSLRLWGMVVSIFIGECLGGTHLCWAGLVGYFKFDGNLQDSSGMGNHGTFSGGTAVYGPDRNGNPNAAIQFDGVNDVVAIGTTGRGSTSFAFGGWIKTSDTHEIDTESTSSTTGTSGQKYAFWPRHEGTQAGAGLSIGTNGISVYEHGDGYMPPLAVYNNTIGDGWNHVMVVYDGEKQVAIYLNGVRVHTGLKSPRTPLTPLEFGGGVYGYFSGLMDEVVIYNQPLSSSQILALYNGASPSNLGMTILNPSFEDPPYPPNYPGYGEVPGWIGGSGVNPAGDGSAPFLNGLTPPDGTHAGFIQSTGSFRQTVYGLTPGQQYVLEYYQDERGVRWNSVAGPSATIDGQTVVGQMELIRTPQFRRVVSRPFTASSDQAVLEISTQSIQEDNTFLLDKVSIRPVGYVVFQDNFDLRNNPSTPHIPAGSRDINVGLAGRQAGYYFGTPYTELSGTAPGGTYDAYSQVDFAGGEVVPGGSNLGAIPDALVLVGGTGSGITRVSPNQNFNLKGIRINQMVFEFDVDPYIPGSGSGDNWAAFRFGDDAPLQSVNSSGSGFGILFRESGAFEAFNGNTYLGSGPAFSGPGFHAIRIEVDLLEFNGSPATIRAYADGSATPFFTYTKTGGFLNNYITLVGYGSAAGGIGHGFDNLLIYTASIPEPASGLLLVLGGLGWAGVALYRRSKRRNQCIKPF